MSITRKIRTKIQPVKKFNKGVDNPYSKDKIRTVGSLIIPNLDNEKWDNEICFRDSEDIIIHSEIIPWPSHNSDNRIIKKNNNANKFCTQGFCMQLNYCINAM